jgi:predicted aspartyl protease
MTDVRIAMPVTINGKASLLAAIDTGGQLSLIDKRVADELMLGRLGSLDLAIGGGRRSRYQLRVAKDIAFGGQFRQKDAVFAETEHVRFGEGVSASLAAGALASFDSELDFVASELRIYPRGGPSRVDWAAARDSLEPPRVHGLSPLFKIEATIGNQTVRAIVDTGGTRGFVVSPRLFDKIATAGNWSPAFKDRNELFRTARALGSASVGGLTLDRPIIASKDISVLGTDAIIGLPVLQQLNLATNVERGILYTKVNGRPAAPPRYNMSGLWIDRDGARIVAGAVGRGSPAEQAGIRVGDQLGGRSFGDLIAALNGPAGSSLSLDVIQASKRHTVNLILNDYL